MKAALYARVSSDRQVDNFSISAQIDLMKEYCIINSIEIHEIYIDEAQKGWREDRPALQKMLKDYEHFDIVLVHKFDRFARKSELSKNLKSKLRKNKVKVISITEPIDDSPMGQFIEGLHELSAELFINNLSDEVKKGKNKRSQKGLFNGKAPYGYDNVDKKLVINEKEAEIVRMIYDEYLIYGMGVCRIATLLNRKNIKTKLNSDFTASRVGYILKNPVYTGKMIYNGEILQGVHDSIITQEQRERVLTTIGKNNMNPRTGKSGYRSVSYKLFWLLEIVKCDVCGRGFTIRSNSKENYYVCSRGYRNSSLKELCCNNTHHIARKFERQIIELLKSFMKGDDIEFNVPNTEDKIDNVSINRLSQVKSELERAKNAYLSGIFDIKEYGDEKKRLENEKESLLHELNRPKSIINPNDYKNKLRNIWKTFINETDITNKRAILQTVVRNIRIDSMGKVKIDFY